MSEKSSAGKKKVVGAGEGSFLAPMMKKKKKFKMHRREVCGKKFHRPSKLRTYMNMHNNERCCTRTFGVRSNAKRHPPHTRCRPNTSSQSQQTTSSALPTP
ncbi:hypothetical protein BYT27DRAFT_7212965 [Phlegmacium glaucopus]|nr:hypothetical protein BYT27DRAFT_7212965 [Phlegmacium glaucopus]